MPTITLDLTDEQIEAILINHQAAGWDPDLRDEDPEVFVTAVLTGYVENVFVQEAKRLVGEYGTDAAATKAFAKLKAARLKDRDARQKEAAKAAAAAVDA